MRYPAALWKDDGQSGGSYVGLPYRVVLHTTETVGLPGYGDGWRAPHVSYIPASGEWIQHTDFDTAARALRNPPGGVQTNRANALQVEIVCYSAKDIADRHPARIWVGDLTDVHYADLRRFLEWTYTTFGVKSVWPGRQALSYTEANASGFRMSGAEWNGFGGVCAHQHVPENTHWDTGALDWARTMEAPMTPTQARLELAAEWHSRTGKWMSGAGDETPQVRLTRLAGDVVAGRRTVADIVRWAGTPGPQVNEAIPAWVLDPQVPAGVLPDGEVQPSDVADAIETHAVNPDAHHA